MLTVCIKKSHKAQNLCGPLADGTNMIDDMMSFSLLNVNIFLQDQRYILPERGTITCGICEREVPSLKQPPEPV